jgi:hypothetical protein
MRKIPTIEVQYYSVNLTVLPAEVNTGLYYTNLIQRLYISGNTINFGAYYYKMTKLDTIRTNDGSAFYGVISKYVSLEDVEWVEENDSPTNYSIPENVKGRRATHEFVFYPDGHRFAFIKRGKIEQTSKRGPAPLKAMVYYLKHAIDLVLETENRNCEVNIIQSDQIFDEIYSSVVKSLDLTVSYSNPGLGGDHDETMDDYLREAHIGKTRVVMSPDSTGEIDTDAVFARGLLDLAKENGKVKAKIETEEGSKMINTENHPDVIRATVERSGNIELKLITKILQQLKRRSSHD